MKSWYEFRCPFCGKVTYLELEDAQVEAYCAGALAQEAFPTLSADDREVIISHMCYDCQHEAFDIEEE